MFRWLVTGGVVGSVVVCLVLVCLLGGFDLVCS